MRVNDKCIDISEQGLNDITEELDSYFVKEINKEVEEVSKELEELSKELE